MTIGLSRSARELLVELAEAQRAGTERGVSEHDLWFTLTVSPQQTTARYAGASEAIQTSDPNAIVVLQANGLIEPFTSIAAPAGEQRYRVTSRGVPLSAGGGM